MGFVGLLNFSLLCFDFLAWPAFALGYPLWASIQAIETSSKYHMRKLVTYWTIFSFISLSEIFFAVITECVPFWPYVKLVMICWLVIPKFDGSCRVYQCVIHPCLSINLQDVINCFCIRKEKTFLISAKKFIKENGADNLEKLIASEVPQIQNSIFLKPDSISSSGNSVRGLLATAAQSRAFYMVEHPKPLLVESEEKEIAAFEAKKATVPTDSTGKRSLEIHALKKVQREWTCAMCQVTTTSEALLNSHLIGKKHQTVCEKLNTCTSKQKAKPKELKTDTSKQKAKPKELNTCTSKQKAKPKELKTDTSKQKAKPKELNTGTSKQKAKPKELNTCTSKQKAKPKELNTCTSKQKAKPKELNTGTSKQKAKPKELNTGTQTEKGSESSAAKTNDSSQAKENLKNTPPVEGSRQNTSDRPKNDPITVATWQQMAMNNNVAGVNSKFWCGVCNIRCTSEIDMAAHLKGRRHVLEVQSKPINSNAGVVNQQPKLWCRICNVKCISEMDMVAHLKGKRHELEVQSKSTNNNAGVIYQQLKLWCGICKVVCYSEVDMAAHLKGKKHELEIESKPMNNNAKVVNQQPKLW